ncbi:unnamed protein product [Microthlaspi erraticum]|uniref:GRF-type domain-containing protein n=1 Tax=Microthlaspi erraticum TaxID=1685480 RepID=A0A6D2K267_9BRAS|nr:unnamed protein product [Microthlaspi erraticum]
MSTSSNHIDNAENSGLIMGVGVRPRRRGFPNVLMKTSGTAKNPGRLFHACPYGSELEKYHFFKWTDVSMVEEIEDMKKKIENLEVQRRSSEEVISCLAKEIETMKAESQGGEKEENEGKEIVGDMPFFKKLVCCFWA